MTRLEELAREIAAELVEGPEIADVLMEERERVADTSNEAWRAYQDMKIECAAVAIEATLHLLAAVRPGKLDPRELEQLTQRLTVGWAKMERLRSAALDDELRDVADGGDAA
jgi:hypothetical protein